MTSSKKGKNTPGAKKSGSGVNWTKVAMVVLGVGFVVVMIVTSLGTGWLVGMKPAQSGDVAVIGLTIRDDLGRAVLTTDERLYTDSIQNGNFIMITGPIQLIVDGNSSKVVEKIPAYHPSIGNGYFGLYNQEFNKVSASLVGMKNGETKRIKFDTYPESLQNITEEQFNSAGGNFTSVNVNDQLMLSIWDPESTENTDNTTPVIPVRIVKIKEKGENYLIIDNGYSSADITIRQLSQASSN
ncbi:MAG: hypothetical protein GKC05_00055 [Methanomicrobiales archaeon]|nr:hypothetical protein [Methanomicrobiales archaeon]NYT21149.1 hypothetical protein [Methanomicrobiales archaeon]